MKSYYHRDDIRGKEAELTRLRADNAKLRAALIATQRKIRSSTENWREDCFFEADLIIITALEETK